MYAKHTIYFDRLKKIITKIYFLLQLSIFNARNIDANQLFFLFLWITGDDEVFWTCLRNHGWCIAPGEFGKLRNL